MRRLLCVLLLGIGVLPGSANAEEPTTTAIMAIAKNIEDLKGADPNGTLLVMWSAQWCTPCKIDKPHVEAVAKKYGWTFVYVDVDDERTKPLRAALKITRLPTYHVFSDGTLVEQVNFDRYKTDGSDAQERVNTRFAQTARKIPKPER